MESPSRMSSSPTWGTVHSSLCCWKPPLGQDYGCAAAYPSGSTRVHQYWVGVPARWGSHWVGTAVLG